MNLKTHRLVRQLHLWIGAWGAIAAILFGISGFMQNHRGIMKLPQGETTEVSNVEVEVPESARASREAMRTWLHDAQHLDVEIQRPRGGGPGAGGRGAEGGGTRDGGDAAKRVGENGGARAGGGGGSGAGGRAVEGSGPRGGEGGGDGRGGDGRGGGEGGRGPSAGKWMFNGGNARLVTQVEYVEGATTATVRKSENSPLATLERLHKGVGGGAAWILLTDSFAVAMVLLGISGILLWARGRTPLQMVFSIVGVAVVVLLVFGGSAII